MVAIRGKFQEWARRLLEAINGMGPAEGSPGLLGNVASNLGVRPWAGPMPNLHDPGNYLDFFA